MLMRKLEEEEAFVSVKVRFSAALDLLLLIHAMLPGDQGPKRLTEDDLNKPVTIKACRPAFARVLIFICLQLEETETFTLFHIPCIKVWGEDTKLAEQVTLENQRYTEVRAVWPCILVLHESPSPYVCVCVCVCR
jgi:hypothetical protein